MSERVEKGSVGGSIYKGPQQYKHMAGKLASYIPSTLLSLVATDVVVDADHDLIPQVAPRIGDTPAHLGPNGKEQRTPRVMVMLCFHMLKCCETH